MRKTPKPASRRTGKTEKVAKLRRTWLHPNSPRRCCMRSYNCVSSWTWERLMRTCLCELKGHWCWERKLSWRRKWVFTHTGRVLTGVNVKKIFFKKKKKTTLLWISAELKTFTLTLSHCTCCIIFTACHVTSRFQLLMWPLNVLIQFGIHKFIWRDCTLFKIFVFYFTRINRLFVCFVFLLFFCFF